MRFGPVAETGQQESPVGTKAQHLSVPRIVGLVHARQLILPVASARLAERDQTVDHQAPDGGTVRDGIGIDMRPAGKIHPAAWTRQTAVPCGHVPIGSLFAQQIIDRSRAVPKDEGVGRTGDLAGEIVGSELRVAVRASCEKQPGDRQAP